MNTLEAVATKTRMNLSICKKDWLAIYMYIYKICCTLSLVEHWILKPIPLVIEFLF